jgi:hypothetical protein
VKNDKRDPLSSKPQRKSVAKPKPEGHGFRRAKDNRRKAATALPKAQAKSEASSAAEGD